MKVLLRRNVRKLGLIGEVVTVRPGYARNFLLPQGLAVAPTKGNLKVIEAEKAAYLQELARVKSELEAQARLLEGKQFVLAVRANEEGHLYGSIGPAQIAALIGKEGFVLDPEHIALPEPIRTVGAHEITVQFSDEVAAKVVLNVNAIKEAGDLEPVAPARETAAPAAESAAE